MFLLCTISCLYLFVINNNVSFMYYFMSLSVFNTEAEMHFQPITVHRQ